MMRTLFSLVLTASFVPLSSTSADSAWKHNVLKKRIIADITGNGKAEVVLVETFLNPGAKRGRYQYFRLTINDAIIYDSVGGFGSVRGIRLANIDRKDGIKEIVVHVPDGEWGGQRIYWFDGNAIHRVVQEPRMAFQFAGNGRVLVSEGQDYLEPEIPYRLGADHTLQPIAQMFFPLNVRAVVKKPFPIYSRPQLKRLAILSAGTKVRFLKTDRKAWCYVSAGKGRRGWMNVRWNSQYEAFGWVAAG